MNFSNKSIAKKILGILLSSTVICSAMYGCSGGSSNDESSAKETVASAVSKPNTSSKLESSKPTQSKPQSSAEESSEQVLETLKQLEILKLKQPELIL